MRTVTHCRATSLVLTIALVGLLLACTSDAVPTGTPSATREATPPPAISTAPSASPSSTPLAPGVIVTPTQAAVVDLTAARETANEVIAAVTAGDVDHLDTLVRYREVPCDGRESREGPPFPDCAGEVLGTPVPAFAAGVCSAVWHRDARPMLQRFVERAGPLHAVLEGPRFSTEYHGTLVDDVSWDVRVVFETRATGPVLGATVEISGGSVDLLTFGCAEPNAELARPRANPPTLVRVGTGFVAPTPVGDQTPTPLEAVIAPRGDRTSIAEVDTVLGAVERGDVETIRTLLRTTTRACTFGLGLGGTPCEAGQTEGELVERFPAGGGCHGGWFDVDLDALASAIVNADVELYAVGAPGEPRGWRQVLFASADGGGFSLSLDGGAIVGHSGYACSSPEERAHWLDIILRGPAWPEDTPPTE